MSLLKVGAAAARVPASAAELNKMTANCLIMRYLYFTGLIAHPNALVLGWGTGLRASTASRASRRSNLVGFRPPDVEILYAIVDASQIKERAIAG